MELVIERTFDAPVDVVYTAWTDPKALGQWWGPAGSTIEVEKHELTPGGIFLFYMEVDGTKLWGRFIYEEIVTNEKLVFINGFSDESGGIGPNPWTDVWPKEIRNVLTFQEADGKTLCTLRGGPINATDEEIAAFENEVSNMHEGFEGSFTQLDDYLASVTQ